MKYRLEELVDLQIGRTPPRKEFEWFNTNGEGYKWVSIKDMGNSGRFISDTSEYLTEAAQKRFGIPIVEKGTLLLSFKLTVGRLCITTDRMLTNEAIAQLPIKDANIVDRDFLYYYLKNYNFHQLGSTSSIATAINSTYLKKMEIDLPPIDQQRAIAAVLSSIDDKIESNNAINNNLMQQAKTIFEAEIVNRTELPNGWKKSNLASIADYLNGLAMQNFRPNDDDQGLPVLKIKELRQGSCDADSERCSSYIKSNYIVNDGDVIFSWSGSLLVDFWCGGICGLNQHLFKVTSTQYAPWFFYSWTNYHLAKFAAIASAKATTMGHIKRSDIEAAEVIIPSPADYERIGALIQPLYDLCVALRLENRKLAATRDSLLPRLLSGDIDISEAII